MSHSRAGRSEHRPVHARTNSTEPSSRSASYSVRGEGERVVMVTELRFDASKNRARNDDKSNNQYPSKDFRCSNKKCSERVGTRQSLKVHPEDTNDNGYKDVEPNMRPRNVMRAGGSLDILRGVAERKADCVIHSSSSGLSPHCRESLLRRRNRALHIVVRVGRAQECRFILRGRQIHAAFEHAAEELSECVGIRLRC